MFPHLGRVFLRYLEVSSFHIGKKQTTYVFLHFLLKLDPSPLSAYAGLYGKYNVYRRVHRRFIAFCLAEVGKEHD